MKEATNQGDRTFLEELKKTMAKKKETQSVPECLEGEITQDGILNKIKELYKDLYNSAGTKEEMFGVKETMNGMINQGSANQCERITEAVVKKACARMKPGKSDVTGNYTSDIFLHAPDIVVSILAEVFKSYLVHGNASK